MQITGSGCRDSAEVPGPPHRPHYRLHRASEQQQGWATSHPCRWCVCTSWRACTVSVVAVRLGAGIHQLALEVGDAWAIRPEHPADDRGRL
jgi:hypothetical protein